VWNFSFSPSFRPPYVCSCDAVSIVAGITKFREVVHPFLSCPSFSFHRRVRLFYESLWRILPDLSVQARHFFGFLFPFHSGATPPFSEDSFYSPPPRLPPQIKCTPALPRICFIPASRFLIPFRCVFFSRKFDLLFSLFYFTEGQILVCFAECRV